MRLPLLLVRLVFLPLFTVAAVAAAPELLWTATGFVAPESVVFDATARVFYVSNMGTFGKGAAAGDGFISRVSATGEVLDLHWITGLENPKGLAQIGPRLYVGDDTDLVEIDLTKAVISRRFAPSDGQPGQFNDCTADPAGNVYVCSGRLHTVFRLQDGVFAPWVELDPAQTGGINGLRAEPTRLLLGGWSRKTADGTEEVGHLSTIDYATKQVGRIGQRPICHIDGLEPDGRSGYTVTDWLTGDVFHVSATGEPTAVMNLAQGTADHTYLPDAKLMVLPQMKENLLRAFRWEP